MNSSASGATTDARTSAAASIQGDEGIIYADIDIELEIARKQWHDIIGHYNRFDVLSLNLNTDADEPLKLRTSRPSAPDSGPAAAGGAMAKLLEQNQSDLRELRQAVESLSRQLEREGT